MSRKGLLAAAAISLLCATGAMAANLDRRWNHGQQRRDAGRRQQRFHQADAPTFFPHARIRPPRQATCASSISRLRGESLAYLEAKLQLTADQKPLWDKWEEATATGSATMKDDCIAGVPAKDTLLDGALSIATAASRSC